MKLLILPSGTGGQPRFIGYDTCLSTEYAQRLVQVTLRQMPKDFEWEDLEEALVREGFVPLDTVELGPIWDRQTNEEPQGAA